MAAIYDKGPGEHLILLATREAHIRPFEATNWLDLRVGFFLSVTQPSPNDDVITGLAEVIGTEPRPSLGWTDRVQIGLTDSNTGTVFCGYSNLPGNRIISLGSTRLDTSDIGVGTTNANFWRPSGDAGNFYTHRIIDSGVSRAVSVTGSQPHFVQNVAGAGGYCTFLGLRFTRPDARGRANIITMSVKKAAGGLFSSDILFTSTPTNAIGEAQLQAFPATVQTLGPVQLSQVPDSLWFYWPFHLSRLRIHEVCIVKIA
jgi:hypothetical protein